MTSKLRIRAGAVEFEYEADSDLSFENVKELIASIESLASASPSGSAPAPDGGATGGGAPTSASGGGGGLKLHVNSIAGKINAKTGADVAVAAAAYLQLVQDKDTFSRSELVAAMKSATKFYNKNYLSNLTKILNGLVGSKFNQTGTDQYSLTQAEHASLETTLA
jgi:hypothetical protein